LKSGSLNLLEPVQACNGIALPLPYLSLKWQLFYLVLATI
jgi:hypothetical protein